LLLLSGLLVALLLATLSWLLFLLLTRLLILLPALALLATLVWIAHVVSSLGLVFTQVARWHLSVTSANRRSLGW
jgi:hypothetical protein